MDLLVAGLSHHTAPLDVRERVALSPEEIPSALSELVGAGGLREALVLSTCNRTEVYGRIGNGVEPGRPMESLEGLRPGLVGAMRQSGYVRGGEEALSHLFRVAAGLDSMVLGENEITRQMSGAYALACSAGTAGPLLHRAVPRALQIGKRVRTETGIARGIASVAGAAVGLADRVFRDLTGCDILGVGAGQTVEAALRALRTTARGRLWVANRTAEKADRLAADLGGEAISLAAASEQAARSDIVVAATNSQEPLLRDGDVAPHLRRRGSRPLLVLDLGVPRDVEPALGKRPGVYLADLDDLHRIAERGRNERAAEVPKAEAIVTLAVTEFRRRRRNLEAEPAIRALLDGLLAMRRDVVHGDRKLREEERAAAERVSGRLIDGLVRRLAPRIKDGTLPAGDLLDALGVERPEPKPEEPA
jgi:glutamyl-tRNA reductase